MAHIGRGESKGIVSRSAGINIEHELSVQMPAVGEHLMGDVSFLQRE
jgi:hypothetical protein